MNQNTDGAWNFDLSSAPRSFHEQCTKPGKGKGGEIIDVPYEVAIDVPVILASKCGKVIKSRWLLPSETAKRKSGRWEGFSAKEQPIAWMPWPSHPSSTRKDEAR